MSAAEAEYSKNCNQRYVIYSLYDYSKDSAKIKFFVIENPTETPEFTPAIFRVRQK